MNTDYVLPVEEIPLGVINNYEEYKSELLSLNTKIKGESDLFIESALELFHELLMKYGRLPDCDEVIMKIHSDQILECTGSVAIN